MPRKTWRAALAAYASPSTLVLLLLGFAAGLPYMLVFSTLSVWLREAGVPLQIVVTKTDKLKSSEKQRNMAIIKERYACDTPPIAYSALKHTGRELLNTRINRILLGDEE